MARTLVPPPPGTYSIGGPKRDAVDSLTGICTWRASIMDIEVHNRKLYKAQHHAEAYHAGDKARTIDDISRGYLLAKYPLVEEYRFFVQTDYWQVVFEAAIREEEKIDKAVETAAKKIESRTLSVLEPAIREEEQVDKVVEVALKKTESQALSVLGPRIETTGFSKLPRSKDREKEFEVEPGGPTTSDAQATLSEEMGPLQESEEGGRNLPAPVEEDLISFD